MRLQMRRIDHQPRWFTGLACQFGEYLVEHPETAPAHEPVIDRLVRTIFAWCIAPAQPVPDDEEIPLITRRSSTLAIPCDNGKYRSIRRICAFDSRNKSAMATPPCASPMNQPITQPARINGS